MMPTVAQQLGAIRQTMNQIVIPALPTEQTFAQEQAGLISVTLDWILDVHESEYRYELVEGEDYRNLLEALLRIEGSEGVPQSAEIQELLSEPAAGTGATAGDLAAVRDQTRRNKALAMAFLATCGRIGEDARRAARKLVMDVAERQSRREQSWYRMTGFTQDVPGEIAAVLAEDAS